MINPKMVIYLDPEGISGIYEQIQGGALIEVTRSSTKDHATTMSGELGAGQGFSTILNLAKISFGFARTAKRLKTEGTTDFRII